MTYNDSAKAICERQKLNLELVERHVAESHAKRMKDSRLEREHLREEYVARFGPAALFEFSKRFRQALAAAMIVLPCLLFAQQPPTPQSIPASAELRTLIQLRQQIGKEGNHYTAPVQLYRTQTVTMVFSSKFLRIIEVTNVATLAMETNYVPMMPGRTSVVSCVTNTTPLIP